MTSSLYQANISRPLLCLFYLSAWRHFVKVIYGYYSIIHAHRLFCPTLAVAHVVRLWIRIYHIWIQEGSAFGALLCRIVYCASNRQNVGMCSSVYGTIHYKGLLKSKRVSHSPNLGVFLTVTILSQSEKSTMSRSLTLYNCVNIMASLFCHYIVLDNFKINFITLLHQVLIVVILQ